MQYLEAIRNLKAQGFKPARSIHVSFVPDEEIGGKDGMLPQENFRLSMWE
jgi:acetylornithine deacetylase/succinyl-diaminopimelate desuccinylase-like protein